MIDEGHPVPLIDRHEHEQAEAMHTACAKPGGTAVKGGFESIDAPITNAPSTLPYDNV